MKIWKTLRIKDQDKKISQISIALANYLYKNGPINNIIRKYNISGEDIKELYKYTNNRIAGILMLYGANDTKRIDDIVNRYSSINNIEVIPELEGYIER